MEDFGPMSVEEKSRLTREMIATPFWKQVFEPIFEDHHDILEEGAYSTNDLHRRYALIEAVKALRIFREEFLKLAENIGGVVDYDTTLDDDLKDDDTG